MLTPDLWLQLEDDPRGYLPGLDLGHRLVDVLERPDFADHACLARPVEFEDLTQVGARPDDRPYDSDAVQDGLEDRQRARFLGRQRYEHERAATPQRAIRLLESLRRHREGD